MHRAELVEEAVVSVSAARAYDVIADASARPSWMVELQAVDARPGPVGAGDRFEGEAELLKHRFIGRSEVTDAVPGRRIEERVVIGARFTSSWEIEDAGEGRSVIRHQLAVEFPRGALGWLGRWILAARLRRMQRRSLSELARKLSL